MTSKKIKKFEKLELILAIIGLLLLLLAAFLYFRNKNVKVVVPESEYAPRKIHGGPCPGETKTFTENDVYMRSIIERGQQYQAVLNYYDCNPLKTGDLVLYSFSTQMDPFVKIVVAVEGDTFKIVKDKQRGAWNLIVNDEMIMTKTDHTPYFFGGDSPATLSLYEKSHNGVLHKDEAILLSSWAPGDNDSGIYGVVNRTDIIGKVVPPSGSGAEGAAQTPHPAPAEAKKLAKKASKKPLVQPSPSEESNSSTLGH